MSWVGVIYHGKIYYVLTSCIRDFVFLGGGVHSSYFNIFSFPFILDKKLGSHTSWAVEQNSLDTLLKTPVLESIFNEASKVAGL